MNSLSLLLLQVDSFSHLWIFSRRRKIFRKNYTNIFVLPLFIVWRQIEVSFLQRRRLCEIVAFSTSLEANKPAATWHSHRYNRHGIANIFWIFCDMFGIIVAIALQNQPCISILYQIWNVLLHRRDWFVDPYTANAMATVWCKKFSVSIKAKLVF